MGDLSAGLLLDTHALLWLLMEPERIPVETLRRLRDRRTELFVSAVSALEIATKHRLGRLPEAEQVVRGYPAHLVTLGVLELPITSAHALAAGELDWEHRDPFDRLLVAQAINERLSLVTADAAITGYAAVTTIWE